MSPSEKDSAALTLLLQSQGPLPGRVLAERLELSQPTLSRRIAELGNAVERLGVTRGARYALRRSVRNLGDRWPLHRIDKDGRAQRIAELRSLHGGFRLVYQDAASPGWLEAEYANGLFSGLPFFLQDVRPQGYLGRAIAKAAARVLGVPTDPRLWQDDDLLTYLLTEGDDLPGNLVLGDAALERWLRRHETLANTAIPESDPAEGYRLLAEAAQRGETAGSSAAGEQPKFLATTRDSQGEFRSVLVKFSSADAGPASERWADLLVCEHLCAEVLESRRIPSAPTRLFDAGGRRFLEVERFDREGPLGRKGLLSLGALADALLDETPRDTSDWVELATLLHREGWLDPASAERLRWLSCFGNLISNTDMHRGNASIWWEDEVPFGLAPSYDMLPMLFAPGAQGELIERSFAPRPPLPSVASVWPEAARGALEFWERVLADSRVSAGFRTIANQARSAVRSLTGRFA